MSREEEIRKGDQALVDIAKRALQSSVKSILSTEEGIRNLITAVLPTDLVRDLLQSVAKQVEGFRKDLVAAMAKEMRHFVDNLDVGEEVKKVLTGVEFEIRVAVKIKEAGGKGKGKKK